MMDKDDMDARLREMSRQHWRMFGFLYWAAMATYGLAFAAFVHHREYGDAIKMVTLAAFVSLAYWVARRIARVKGEWP